MTRRQRHKRVRRLVLRQRARGSTARRIAKMSGLTLRRVRFYLKQERMKAKGASPTAP